MWKLLAKQVSLYTMGESTSLPEHDAYRLLASTCYVLGVDADDAAIETMRDLLEQGVEEAFSRNVAAIEEQTRRVDGLWREACLAMPLLESVALKDTLESLRGFSARYEPRFFAHEIPADIDYPLCHPVPETTLGVEYVTAYLERLLAECRFLRMFDLGRCQTVLRCVHPEYGELIINLYEPIATAAIGCALGGCDVRGLRMDVAACRRAQEALEGAEAAEVVLGSQSRVRESRGCEAALPVGSRSCVRQALETAALHVSEALALDDDARASLVSLAADLVPRVALAARRNTLASVFLSE